MSNRWKLVALAGLCASLFAMGWVTNGWRKDAEIAELTAARAGGSGQRQPGARGSAHRQRHDPIQGRRICRHPDHPRRQARRHPEGPEKCSEAAC